MIENLLSDYETIIRNIREDIVNVGDKFKDLGTADFLTELMVKHEKTAWMLRSFLHNIIFSQTFSSYIYFIFVVLFSYIPAYFIYFSYLKDKNVL
jgi:hypothetical protein